MNHYRTPSPSALTMARSPPAQAGLGGNKHSAKLSQIPRSRPRRWRRRSGDECMGGPARAGLWRGQDLHIKLLQPVLRTPWLQTPRLPTPSLIAHARQTQGIPSLPSNSVMGSCQPPCTTATTQTPQNVPCWSTKGHRKSTPGKQTNDPGAGY